MAKSTEQPILNEKAKIGIANRGEAALRFIRAVREYNELYGTQLESVAMFVDSERDAPFVNQADYQVALSSLPRYPGKQATPYLDHELLLSGLKAAGCEGVWVGWGFVSEDHIFAEKVEKEGIVFLGPSSTAMSNLGDKITAKDVAEKAEVPICPWSKGPVTSFEEAKRVSDNIGYPVIVKASNAGGGRGIRFVFSPDQLERQYTSARDETKRITGNEVVFIEHLVAVGRHLEVQVLADMHGNVSTFGVRDCSVQRKNQKIIEETPPPHIDQGILAQMENAASRLISEAGYVGAGTVEFLFDIKTRNFYFMEVNTRLQVEHPITETLYGIDLVQGQIDVARGKEIDYSWADPLGHVAEVRLNAEDPDKDFTPSPGKVTLFTPPAGHGIRVDSGVEQGSDIPSEFDSMVAKIIAHGPNRLAALAKLRRALKEMTVRIENGTTNKAFLLKLLAHEKILEGGVHTKFVEEEVVSEKIALPDETKRIGLFAGAIHEYYKNYTEDSINFKEQVRRVGSPRTLPEACGYDINLALEGNSYSFFVEYMGEGVYHIHIDGKVYPVRYLGDEIQGSIIYHGTRYTILLVPRGDSLQVEVGGIPVVLEKEGGGYVTAPSPAIVLSINCKPEDQVKKGDILLILEAMKMEMVVEAPGDGVVKDITVAEGMQVAAGQALVMMELGEGEEEEVEEAEEPVRFEHTAHSPAEMWHIYRNELRALFLGYDVSKYTPIEDVISFINGHTEFIGEFIRLCNEAIDMYSTLQRLFMGRELTSQGGGRSLSYKELLTYYVRREHEKEKGVPEEFNRVIEHAASFYPDGGTEDGINSALFHMYRSHGMRTEKQKVLKNMLFAIEEFSIKEEDIEIFEKNIDALIDVAQDQSLSLTDAAFHARYEIIDTRHIQEEREKKQKVLTDIINSLETKWEDAETFRNTMATFVDAGPEIVYDLIALASEGSRRKQELVARILVLRVVRDLECGEHFYFDADGCPAAGVRSKTPDGKEKVSVCTVTSKPNKKLLQCIDKQAEKHFGKSDEMVIIVDRLNNRRDEKAEKKETIDIPADLNSTLVSTGWYYGNKTHFYKTFEKTDAGWQETLLRRGFSPLEYRELRIQRLGNFDNKVVYKSRNVTVLESTAKDNPKDIRLFALALTSENEPEITSTRDISRMVMFEAVFMEAVSALRAAQAEYRYRLQWNRVIVYNRSLLGLSLHQLREYGLSLVSRVKGLGIERAIVYSRRKRWYESVVRENELMFLNVTADKFSLRSRKPSSEPLRTLDQYESKVVKARQRSTVYPYELVRMLTNAGFTLYDSFPRGEFEEFDIEISGKQSVAVSVKGREPGQNEANLMFGIISNTLEGQQVRRVLILSDPTKALGSLAEPECRRVNAALDLAEKEGIPVEWVTISSGAKITMDSGTENLDWTAATLRRIVEFTQAGGEINIIIPGINVGAQSYWNAESTMLMHTRGLLIMTEQGAMLLTGKKALDFSGSISAETNQDIGGVEKIMGPNGQAQIRVPDISSAYEVLFRHYFFTYVPEGKRFPLKKQVQDPAERDVTVYPYNDPLGQGFENIGDIFSKEKNPERKKPFDMRQVMAAIKDEDYGYLERWRDQHGGDTSIVWETCLGGNPVGMVGIESRAVKRMGTIPPDGPESWSGGTLYPISSKKVARGINAFSGRLPLVILANLSGFDGSPESLRELQLEYGAEIGRAIVNFDGPIAFLVMARYHGGAYVVFSKSLNEGLTAGAIEGSYASVIGGAPAAAVVFPKQVLKDTYTDSRIKEKQKELKEGRCTQKDFDELFQKVYTGNQTALGQKFDSIHSVARAKEVGSIDDVVKPKEIRPYLISVVEKGIKREQ